MPITIKPASLILLGLAAFVATSAVPAPAASEVLILEKGRHLFIDDYLLAESANLKAALHHPKKLGRPLHPPGSAGISEHEPRRNRVGPGSEPNK